MSEQRYPMAPLIRFTLVSLYFALVFPLPWLAPSNLQPWLIGALPVGFLLVWALVSEEVSLNEAGLQVGYPRWCSWLLRRGWSLNWDQVKGLTPVATSQGGRVFYVRTEDGSAYLLPPTGASLRGIPGPVQPEDRPGHALHRPDQPPLDLPAPGRALPGDAGL